ncbi:uncharacterized protein LOC114957077 [Acropora millepora]|uniref:uncharacterized protein LOC114957077 n=1 Tax=Acropora millepora TaxID=45264 RepID=UPI001CF3A37F|nr:uncharacterized protein LOC114957077 [Acropora millepora]
MEVVRNSPLRQGSIKPALIFPSFHRSFFTIYLFSFPSTSQPRSEVFYIGSVPQFISTFLLAPYRQRSINNQPTRFSDIEHTNKNRMVSSMSPTAWARKEVRTGKILEEALLGLTMDPARESSCGRCKSVLRPFISSLDRDREAVSLD